MFVDRQQAGRLLSEKIPSQTAVGLVLGLARGGVCVSSEISKKLHVSHDVLVVKKIGSPHDPELAIGAVAPDGVSYVDYKMAQMTGADETYLRTKISELNDQIKQKTLLYRKGKKPLNVKDQIVFIVDDGAATGATIFAAITWAKKKHAKRILVGLPVAPPELANKLKSVADNVILIETPPAFSAVGQWYRDFPQLTDKDVVELLI